MAEPAEAEKADDAPPVAVGDILADKYRVERVLGAGGMGVVLAATHVELEELRALKFMLPKVSSDAEAVTRFFREARAAARLKSEYVASIFDIGRLDSGLPYMVMEYLEGDDLREVLKVKGKLPVRQAVDYTMQALAGLAEAHAVGVVHRDLKPANIFLTKATDGLPRVKIVDFGISKLTSAAAVKPTTEVTQTTALLGSPHYMSPEQLACARFVDARADVWSMGIMLYEMLVGRVPFDGPSLTAITIVVVQKEPDKPSELRLDVPPGLDEVVLRCIAKRPEDRYRNVAAMAWDLAPFGSKRARQLADHVQRVHQAAKASGRDSIADGREVAGDDDEDEDDEEFGPESGESAAAEKVSSTTVETEQADRADGSDEGDEGEAAAERPAESDAEGAAVVSLAHSPASRPTRPEGLSAASTGADDDEADDEVDSEPPVSDASVGMPEDEVSEPFAAGTAEGVTAAEPGEEQRGELGRKHFLVLAIVVGAALLIIIALIAGSSGDSNAAADSAESDTTEETGEDLAADSDGDTDADTDPGAAATASGDADEDEVEDAGKPIKKKRRRRSGEDIYDDVDRAGDDVYDDDPYEGPRRPRKRRWQPAEL